METSVLPVPPVGRVLARLGGLVALGRDDPQHSIGESRTAVLVALESAGAALRVDEIAEAVGLHPNTVRGHLDSLLAAGRVTRIPDQRTSRGRPHWLYSATSAATVRELGRALNAELAQASSAEVAQRAAAAWAQGADVGPADSIGAAVESVTEALPQFGFEATHNAVGDQISLQSCPYAQVVREHPVICDIHAELLAELLDRTGQPVTLAGIDVFPRPGVCVARLNRPDVSPEWVVAGRDHNLQSPRRRTRS